MVDIRETNLNLLVAFDALFEEGNVTQAARRIGVTQSSMSATLKRLRELFDDPLFVRTQRGISPTEKAVGLSSPIRTGLKHLQLALEPSRFDPSTSERTFVLAASDYMEFVMLPPLLRRLAREAPHVRIRVRPWGQHEPSPELRTKEADLMLGYTGKLPPHFHELPLFEERYVCLVRKGHPTVSNKLSLRAYLKLSHVVVSQSGQGDTASVDRALAKLGKTRTVGATVSHFLMVPRLIAETNMVAALSERIALAFQRTFPIRTLSPPLSLPKGRPSLVWHEHVHGDAGHAWFRRIVQETANSV